MEDESQDKKQPAKNGLTKVERYLHNILSSPIDLIRFPYESNALEHLPSRLLSLAPNPFATLIGLCISNFADSLATTPQGGNINSSSSAQNAQAASAPSAANTDTPLTEQISQSFVDAQNLTAASVLQCCKNTRKKVKAIYEILPDDALNSNVYWTANLPEGVETEHGSFLLASEQSSQSCMYKAETENLPEGVTLGPNDTFGVPVAMFNYQHSSSQAPKRWLVLRRPRDSNIGYVSEMSGRRIALSLDREFSIESNSSIYLKAENKDTPSAKKRRLD